MLSQSVIKSTKNTFFHLKTVKLLCTKSPTKIKKQIGFIGDGNMAKSICKSIACKGLIDYSQVHVSSPYIKNLCTWQEFGANITTDNAEVAQKSDIIFLAVKPHMINEVLDKLIEDTKNNPLNDKLFVSILAGITLKELEQKIKAFQKSRIVRVMPNIPMVVGEGYSVYCPGKNVTESDLNDLKSLLEVTGMIQMLPEHMMNAVGAIASSGPAFVCLFVEALSDGGVRMGLHREMSTIVATQTVLGAAKLIRESNKHTGVLKDEVCSAGGTTIAGVHALERGGLRAAVMNAVEAASKRADELSNK